MTSPQQRGQPLLVNLSRSAGLCSRVLPHLRQRRRRIGGGGSAATAPVVGVAVEDGRLDVPKHGRGRGQVLWLLVAELQGNGASRRVKRDRLQNQALRVHDPSPRARDGRINTGPRQRYRVLFRRGHVRPIVSAGRRHPVGLLSLFLAQGSDLRARCRGFGLLAVVPANCRDVSTSPWGPDQLDGVLPSHDADGYVRVGPRVEIAAELVEQSVAGLLTHDRILPRPRTAPKVARPPRATGPCNPHLFRRSCNSLAGRRSRCKRLG